MFVISSDNSVFKKCQVSLVSISITVRKSRYNHKSSPFKLVAVSFVLLWLK